MDEYDEGLVCALSGVAPSEDELDSASLGEDDNDAPVDWIQVTLSRKIVNPLYVELVEAKIGLVAGIMESIEDPQEREKNRRNIEMQVAAQFAALEQSADYTPVLTESVVRYLAPTSYAEGLVLARNELLESLGLGESIWMEKAPEPDKPAIVEEPGIIEDSEASAE